MKTYKLGFYTQFDPVVNKEMLGLAILSYENGQPYGYATKNVPNRFLGKPEFIGLQNAAYVPAEEVFRDKELLEKGIAQDTGFTRELDMEYGCIVYPLWLFDEEWLRSLEVIGNYTYDDYAAQYRY